MSVFITVMNDGSKLAQQQCDESDAVRGAVATSHGISSVPSRPDTDGYQGSRVRGGGRAAQLGWDQLTASEQKQETGGEIGGWWPKPYRPRIKCSGEL